MPSFNIEKNFYVRLVTTNKSNAIEDEIANSNFYDDGRKKFTTWQIVNLKTKKKSFLKAWPQSQSRQLQLHSFSMNVAAMFVCVNVNAMM